MKPIRRLLHQNRFTQRNLHRASSRAESENNAQDSYCTFTLVIHMYLDKLIRTQFPKQGGSWHYPVM